MNDKLTVNHPARRIFRFIESCSRSQTALDASPDDRQFNELALDLFTHQFERNESYRRFCELRRLTPGDVVHWSAIPTVPTAAFKEFELSCLPPELRTTVFHSSGTTGQKPSRHFHSVASLELYHASLLPWFGRHVVPGDSAERRAILSLTPPPDHAEHSSLAHMFGVLISEMGSEQSAFAGTIGPDGAWWLNVEHAVAWLRDCVDTDAPVILLGTAFNLVHLLDHVVAQGVRMCLARGSTVMETGGYKGRSRELSKAELHRLITSCLGVPDSQIVCEYGMSELSSQAYDRFAGAVSGGRLFRFPPWARFRIISPETGSEVLTGESGLLRVFDLANAFSALAIQTEDLAVCRDDGFELIGRSAVAEPRGCSLTSL